VNNENLYLARSSVVDFRRLQALRIQTLDVHGDRGGLQAPVQRRTNKRASGADILTRQTSVVYQLLPYGVNFGSRTLAVKRSASHSMRELGKPLLKSMQETNLKR
jgi:hypothetical protein